MLREILNLFRNEDPDATIREHVSEMLVLSQELIEAGGASLFSGHLPPQKDKEAFYAKDQRINALQQKIRKHLVGRLELSNATERARFLVIYGLIKDIERLGDYAKNLLETAELLGHLRERPQEFEHLRLLASEVEETLRRTRTAFEAPDAGQARPIMMDAAETAERCESFIAEITRSNLPTSTAVPLALAARHYKRIEKHLSNALSTLVMPLHKIDYFE